MRYMCLLSLFLSLVLLSSCAGLHAKRVEGGICPRYQIHYMSEEQLSEYAYDACTGEYKEIEKKKVALGYMGTIECDCGNKKQ